MNPFRKKKILLEADALSGELRTAREKKGLKLEEAAAKLNINPAYLEALEKGRFDRLPQGVYGKNFLREYAQFLGLDAEELVKIFAVYNSPTQKGQQKELFAKQVAKAHYFLTLPKIIKGVLLLLVVAACLYYLNFRLQKIVAPPRLFLNNPQENLVTKKNSIEVAGFTEPEAQILVNGEVALGDTNGYFSQTVSLKNGLNTITVTAQKKYGRKNTIVRQIMVAN